MYNYIKIKKEIYKLVRQACFSSKNKFTETVWNFHLMPVVKYSLRLGGKMKADLEVLEMAALLHDYSCFINPKYYESHHIHSANFAKKILRSLNFPSDKIEKVEKCIITHRGSIKISKVSIEEKILASADAMSHITALADMFYLAYGVHRYKTLEGVKWLKEKLKRSWKKIMQQGKVVIKEEYIIAMKIINQALKNNS